MEPPLETIPQRERKHPDEATNGCFQPPPLYGRQHDLSIGVPSPLLRPKLRTNGFVVVDLAIEDDGKAARGGHHWLMPFCREVDDGKSSERKAQASIFIKEDAGVVRPTMGQCVSHATQEFGGLMACLFSKPEPSYAAHGNSLPLPEAGKTHPLKISFSSRIRTEPAGSKPKTRLRDIGVIIIER